MRKINVGGYGIVPNVVMSSKKISATAKLLYAFLLTFRGNKNFVYPRISLICSELGISRLTVYKYRKQLEEVGLIKFECFRGCRNNKFGTWTRYIFTDDIYLANCGLTPQEAEVAAEADSIIAEESAAIKAENTINSALGQHKAEITANDRYKECDIENCTNYLVKHSIKPISDMDIPKIRQGVSNLCDAGYTTSQIADAWKLYRVRCHKNNPDTTRYVKPLLNWLNSQDGVFWDIRGTEKVKKRNSSEKIIAEPDSCADKPRQEHPIINDRYAKLCTEWDGRLTKMMRNDLVGEKEAAVQLAYELMPIHKEMCEIEKNAHVVIEHTEVRRECLASVLGGCYA